MTDSDISKISGLRSKVSNLSCNFYGDFDAVFDYCGEEGYVNSFGHHYCNEYLAHRDEFKNKEWQDSVRSCLQNKLVDYALAQKSFPTCKQISDAGFGSHQGCYLQPNPAKKDLTWCNLPFLDMVKVAWIAKGAYWEVLAQGIPILLKCFTPSMASLE